MIRHCTMCAEQKQWCFHPSFVVLWGTVSYVWAWKLCWVTAGCTCVDKEDEKHTCWRGRNRLQTPGPCVQRRPEDRRGRTPPLSARPPYLCMCTRIKTVTCLCWTDRERAAESVQFIWPTPELSECEAWTIWIQQSARIKTILSNLYLNWKPPKKQHKTKKWKQTSCQLYVTFLHCRLHTVGSAATDWLLPLPRLGPCPEPCRASVPKQKDTKTDAHHTHQTKKIQTRPLIMGNAVVQGNYQLKHMWLGRIFMCGSSLTTGDWWRFRRPSTLRQRKSLIRDEQQKGLKYTRDIDWWE